MSLALPLNRLAAAVACGVAAQIVLATGDIPMAMRLYAGAGAMAALMIALVPVGFGVHGPRLAKRILLSVVITAGFGAYTLVSQGKPYEAAACALVAVLCLLVRPEPSRPAMRA